MADERFPKQEERELAGGQHGTQNIGGSADNVGSRSRRAQPSEDPQLRRVHEAAETDEEAGRGNETRVEDGGSRHRTQ